jgi:hypothetical protein
MKSSKDEQYVSLARETLEEDGWQPRMKAPLRDPRVLVFASSMVDWIGAYFCYHGNQLFFSAAVFQADGYIHSRSYWRLFVTGKERLGAFFRNILQYINCFSECELSFPWSMRAESRASRSVLSVRSSFFAGCLATHKKEGS